MQLVAVLDNIRSLYNVGSMFRTADALGISKMYLCGITGTPQHSRMTTHQLRDPDDRLQAPKLGVEKTALAAFDAVPWEHCESTCKALERLKETGFAVIALELTGGSIPLSASNLAGVVADFNANNGSCSGIALVVGNERDSIAPDVLEAADAIFHIPMHGQGASMNVAVSFAIAAWELTKAH